MESPLLYQTAVITEALIEKIESLKVEIDAQQQVIAALQEERLNTGDESVQEKQLAEGLYMVLDLIKDASNYDADPHMVLRDIEDLVKEVLSETNYDTSGVP